jgi:hypothetical protein
MGTLLAISNHTLLQTNVHFLPTAVLCEKQAAQCCTGKSICRRVSQLGSARGRRHQKPVAHVPGRERRQCDT